QWPCPRVAGAPNLQQLSPVHVRTLPLDVITGPKAICIGPPSSLQAAARYLELRVRTVFWAIKFNSTSFRASWIQRSLSNLRSLRGPPYALACLPPTGGPRRDRRHAVNQCRQGEPFEPGPLRG